MATLTYLSFPEDVYKGNIDCDTDTFYAMLVTSAYTPNQTTHVKRSDITNEVVGTGYTAGGQAITCTVSKNTGTKQIILTFASINWPTATFTARAMVIYKRRGGAASADELVGYDDFGADITATAATFTVAQSTFTHTVTV